MSSCLYHCYLVWYIWNSNVIKIHRNVYNLIEIGQFTKIIFYWWRGCLLICQTEYLIYFCSCFFSLKWKFIAIFLIYGFLKDYIKIQLKWTQNGFKVPSYDIDIIPRLRLLQGKRLNHNIVEFAARKRWAVSD